MTQPSAPEGYPVTHLFLSTAPFIILFSYFLYLAYERPSYDPYYGDDKAVIPLMDMLLSFLFTFLLWSILTVYLTFFMKKRRDLIQKYGDIESSGGNVKVVLGDVYYDRPNDIISKVCGRCSGGYTDYAYVIYPYTETNLVEPTYVQKKIRTYHLHHREKVSVLVLPGLPFSGQPKSDIKRDLATYLCDGAIRNRDRIRHVIYVCMFWLVFLLSSAIYLVIQLRAFNDAMQNQGADELMEDADAALALFCIMVFVVAPVVAIGGNLFKWHMYKYFVTKGGSIKTQDSVKVVPKTVQAAEFSDDEEGMFCTAMACGDNEADSYRAMS